jgi:hypothetical protein
MKLCKWDIEVLRTHSKTSRQSEQKQTQFKRAQRRLAVKGMLLIWKDYVGCSYVLSDKGADFLAAHEPEKKK